MQAPAVPAVAHAELTLALPGRAPVAARRYGERKPEGGPLVLHFHGGTFACGSLEHGGMVAGLLASAGAVVVSLAYPIGADNPFPASVEVGYDALAWLYRQRTRLAGKEALLYLAGEEAGANLAAALALIARDRGQPPVAGQILLSPMLDPCAGTASLRLANRDAHECPWAAGWQAYLRTPQDALHPYAVPAASLRLAGLPPALLLVGEQGDAMRDEGLRFARRLSDAGVAVTQRVLPIARRWPGALSEPAGAECCCGDAVRQALREFFATAAAARG